MGYSELVYQNCKFSLFTSHYSRSTIAIAVAIPGVVLTAANIYKAVQTTKLGAKNDVFKLSVDNFQFACVGG